MAGPTRPTDKELTEAFQEEHDAALAYAKVSSKETLVQIEKTRARQRLRMARERKAAVMEDLMEI